MSPSPIPGEVETAREAAHRQEAFYEDCPGPLLPAGKHSPSCDRLTTAIETREAALRARADALEADVELLDAEQEQRLTETLALRARIGELEGALRRIGQVDTDTGMMGDDYCAECGGWTQRDWTEKEVDGRVSCGSDCPGRIARRALGTPKETT